MIHAHTASREYKKVYLLLLMSLTGAFKWHILDASRKNGKILRLDFHKDTCAISVKYAIVSFSIICLGFCHRMADVCFSCHIAWTCRCSMSCHTGRRWSCWGPTSSIGWCSPIEIYTYVYAQYGAVIMRSIFLQNCHHRYSIARPKGWRMGCLLWVLADLYSALVNAMPYEISCCIGLC